MAGVAKDEGGTHVKAPSLAEWEARLAARFADLRAERDAVRPGSPLFALEHGLSLDDELPEVQAAVRRAVLGPRLPRSAGLPFVVYAAEIGYGYRGDEFWPGFEEATPNWVSHGIDSARRFIRKRFAENTELLGLVAAALLVGEEEDTALLTSGVLHRIVTDLSRERQAGAWS